MTVAITGASGNLGRRTAELLLERVDPSDVVLVSRNPDAVADLGTIARKADLDDPASLPAAFEGVDRLLIISTDALGRRVAQHSAAVDAAKAAGVKHIAYTSLPRPDGNPAAVAAEHHESEQYIRASGLDWTILRNNVYADFQLPGIATAREIGKFVTNSGDGRAAYVTREDCAAAAAAVLATGGHAGQAYDITGPAGIAAADLAALAGGVEVVNLDDDAFTEHLVGVGLPAGQAAVIASFGRSIREGWLEDVSDAVESLTGRAPTPLADLVASAGQTL